MPPEQEPTVESSHFDRTMLLPYRGANPGSFPDLLRHQRPD